MRVAYLGLGSNIGDRLGHLRDAAAVLPSKGVRVLAGSSVYETEPVGMVLEQRDFYNACLRTDTDLGPEELLDVCKAVERELGRKPGGVRHGPREIDVDLLMFDDLEYTSDRLTLPHPTITERRFVLIPLLELEPALALPHGIALSDALEALGPGEAVRRVSPPLTDG